MWMPSTRSVEIQPGKVAIMRIYKTKRKSKNGKTVDYDRWYIDFTDHLDRRQRWQGFANKKLTESVGRSIVELVRYKIAQQQPDPSLILWLETIPDTLRKRLVKAGILDTKRAAGAKSLLLHLKDFKTNLRDKGRTEKYIKLTASRIKSTIVGCKFRSWSDISPSGIENYLASLRENHLQGEDIVEGINAKTFNNYMGAIKQFCRWMVSDHRAAESPIAHLKKIEAGKVKSEQRRNRRVLEISQLCHLLAVTMDQPTRFGLTGPHRAMSYRLAAESGLRANEIRSLTRDSFDLDNCTVTIHGASAKNRKSATLPLKTDTVVVLEPFLKNKLPSALVFPLPTKTSNMIKKDLEAAKIPYEDEAGRVFDFHALRHQTGTMLATAGVTPKVAQTLLRHSDINLTMGIYSHTLTGQESQAIESMPDLTPKDINEAQKMTGTEDQNCVATSVAILGGSQRIVTDCNGESNHSDGLKTAFLTSDARNRTGDLRAMNPQGRLVSDCNKMVYNCKITTYDAGRAPSEAQKRPRSAAQLRAWLRA